MKIKDLLYKTPEMTEEKLLEIIKSNSSLMSNQAKRRLQQLHPEKDISEAFLKEYDLIQEKKSYLTKSQREQVLGFVGYCLILMTKNENKENSEDSIPEAEIIGDDSDSRESL